MAQETSTSWRRNVFIAMLVAALAIVSSSAEEYSDEATEQELAEELAFGASGAQPLPYAHASTWALLSAIDLASAC